MLRKSLKNNPGLFGESHPGIRLYGRAFTNNDTNMRTTYYRSIDMDEFPIGSYIENKTGRAITHFYKPATSSVRDLCHFVEDVDNLLKEFPAFQKIYSFESWEPDDASIKSTAVYEWSMEEGVILLMISNYPTAYKGKKPKKKLTLSMTLVSNTLESVFTNVRDFLKIGRAHV